MIDKVIGAIQDAQTILLTTHRQCDGDGLGSELGMYHALKKIGKTVRILNVDGTPSKYDFLEPDKHIQYFDGSYDPIQDSDLALIFDTNDKRLVEPLYQQIETHCKKIVFVDHHPILKEGPRPTSDSIINVSAASTGELAYDIIMGLNIELDQPIACALYTSLVFDTQLFRYVRNSHRSHEVAAHLLKYEKQPAKIHQALFGNFTAAKLRFMAQALSRIEFYFDDQLAILLITSKELKEMGLKIDDSRDLIDMIMNIETVEAAAMFRQDNETDFKLSLRSKGQFPVTAIAESLGGGGHPFASGASVKGSYPDLREKVKSAMAKHLELISAS